MCVSRSQTRPRQPDLFLVCFPPLTLTATGPDAIPSCLFGKVPGARRPFHESHGCPPVLASATHSRMPCPATLPSPNDTPDGSLDRHHDAGCLSFSSDTSSQTKTRTAGVTQCLRIISHTTVSGHQGERNLPPDHQSVLHEVFQVREGLPQVWRPKSMLIS